MKSIIESFRASLGGWFFPLWSVGVFSLYFSFHSLFDLSFLSNLTQDLGQAHGVVWVTNLVDFLESVCVCGLTGLVVWRLGRSFLKRLQVTLVSSTLKLCFEIGLGITLLNTLWLGLGLNGLWFKPFIVFLDVVLLIWASWDFWREGLRWSPVFSLKFPPGHYGFIAFLVLALIGLQFAQVWAPETYFDALVYHLSTLSFWGFHHGIVEEPGNLYAHFPFGAELYLWNGFFLAGSQAAKLLNIFILILTSLAAGAWVAEEGTLGAGALTAASILFLPLLSTTTWAAQNDVFLALFMLLFVYALVKWSKEENNSWFIVAGLMGGAAWTVKYTTFIGLVAVFVVWIFMVSRSWLRGHLGRWMAMRILIFLSVIPWFLKNYVDTGDPVYPYLSQWFGGQSLPPENLTALMGDHETPWFMNHSVWDWMVQVVTRDLDKTVAPLLLAFIPLWFLKGPRQWSARYLLFTSVLYLILGFVVSHQLRLAIPALVLLFAAMGLVLNELGSEKIRVWSWVVLAFGVFSFVSLARVSISYYQWDKMLLGVQTKKEYLETNPQTRSYFGLTEAVENFTAPSARFLLVGDARSLYFNQDFYANSVFDRQLLATLAQDEKNGEGIYHQLKERGIDDLVISDWEGQRLAYEYASYYPLSAEEWTKVDDFIQHRTDLSYISGDHAIYHLRVVPLARSRTIPDLLLLLKSPVPNS